MKRLRVWAAVAALGFVLVGCVQGAPPSGSVSVPRTPAAVESSTTGASEPASGAVPTETCPAMSVSADYCRRLAAWMRQQNGVYERGRFPGVEEVKVLLVFDVAETSDSAVLHIQNVEVR